MKKIILVTVIVLLASCATEKGYREYLATWQGVDVLTLVRTWGAPEEVYSVEGHDFYVYKRVDYRDNPMYPETCSGLQEIEKDDTDLMKKSKQDRNEAVMKQCLDDRQRQPRKRVFHCQTTFEVTDRKVINYSFKGNDCVK